MPAGLRRIHGPGEPGHRLAAALQRFPGAFAVLAGEQVPGADLLQPPSQPVQVLLDLLQLADGELPRPGLLANLGQQPARPPSGYERALLTVTDICFVARLTTPLTSTHPPPPRRGPAKDLLHLAQAVYSNADMTAIRFRLVNQWTLEQICPSTSPSRRRQSSGWVFELMLLICSGAKATRTPGLLHTMNHPWHSLTRANTA